MIYAMAYATLFLLLLGLGAAVLLAIASQVFYVWEDPKVLSITDALSGANCGGCGYAGCHSAAEAIVAGKAQPDLCVAGGFETALAVAELMGITIEAKEPELAATSCSYGTEEADALYTYNGARDCQAAVLLYGGSKLCPVGCIGLGSCIKACQFGAVVIGDDGLPVFDAKACVGCGACVKTCPKNILTLTSSALRVVGEYATTECIAPCQRSCPTGIDIPAYIAAVRDGHYEEGLRIIKERNPLPLICGRICPAPCEFDCRRGLVDEALAINPLKRFLADYEMATGKHIQPFKAPESGKKIAIIGGGAEGLTLAYYLARLGHKPTIFEARPEMGGILRYAISEDRLKRDVLDHDIEGILDMGVEARTSQELGRDFHFDALLREEGYDAVALTSGGYDSRKLLLGEQNTTTTSSIMLMIDFLAARAKGRPFKVGKRVVIVRGGPTSIAIARACNEMGAEHVTLVSNIRQEDRHESLRETEALARENIEVRSNVIVAAFGGEGGQLKRVALEEASSSNVPPVQETIQADTLIISSGRIPELVFVPAGPRDKENETHNTTRRVAWQTIEIFRTFPHGGDNGVFSAAEQGQSSDSEAVVKAILSGRRLCRAIDQYLSGQDIAPIANLACEEENILNLTEIPDGYVQTSPREMPPVAEAEHGSENYWIATPQTLSGEEIPGLDEAASKREAQRCLECGLICYKKAK